MGKTLNSSNNRVNVVSLAFGGRGMVTNEIKAKNYVEIHVEFYSVNAELSNRKLGFGSAINLLILYLLFK